MPVDLVDSDQMLREKSAAWSRCRYLALDTEFMRTNTFYPKLGLLQLSDGEHCWLIDPLCISDWSPFLDLFADPDICFVVHSAGEDLILLYTCLGQIPKNLFDTQIAAAFLGIGFSLSYQALVREMIGVEVEKDETRSDWLQRPLSDSQLRYAAMDVRHLLVLRDLLAQQLQDSGKNAWFYSECQQMLNIALDFEAPQIWASMYRSVNNAWRLDRKGLLLLQRLCFWREQEARRKNRPRNWIAKDAELYIIASAGSRAQPLELQQLLALKDVQPGLLKHRGKRLLQVMYEPGQELPGSEPESLSPPLSPQQRNLLKRCQQTVKNKAEELHMAPELLARKKQLLELLDGWLADGRLSWQGDMATWRRELLEPEFQNLFNAA